MPFIIRKKFSIDMSHILEDAFTKQCCNLHGHTYTVELEISGNVIDKYGMVVDYGFVKEIFDKEIKSEYDHSALIPPKWHDAFKDIPGVINVGFNPTAESIAYHFYNLLAPNIFRSDYKLTAVSVKETDTNYACYRPNSES